MTRSLVLLALALAASTPAAAREVRLPLTVEPPILRDGLVRQIFTEPGERTHVFGSEAECAYLILEKPEVVAEPGRIRVLSQGRAELGADMGDSCVAPVAWSGTIEVLERPRLDGWQLRFDVVDTSIRDTRGGEPALVGPLWDRIKTSIQPHFAPVVVDLGEPFRELREFLPTVVPPEQAEEARRVLATLRPVAVTSTVRGVVVEAVFDVADVPKAEASPVPEGPLTPEEVEAFTARLDRYDAFLTFVVKVLAGKTLSDSSRQTLLRLLIDARYQILDVLEKPVRGADPVRMLFLRAWSDLAPIASELAAAMPGAEALRVTTFVAAGDALAAFDAGSASFGVELSADGLRRMARMIEPDASGDPLESPEGVDPTLRDLFGLGLGPLDAEPVPPPEPHSLWRWLTPREAHAEEEKSPDWKEWMFGGRDDLIPYLGKVGRLLRKTAGTLAAAKRLEGDAAEMFRHLVPVTAWQETCWRQFVARAGEVTYIRSARGSVGIMQVNERIWRGFYKTDRLRWDVAYNAQAGTEILEKYVTMARAESQSAAKDPKKLAHAAYAAYNGGPGQLRRYLDAKKRGPALKRVIDKLFGKKFDVTDADLEKRVGKCLVG